MARLQEGEPRPGVAYVAGRVGLPPDHPLEHPTPGYNWTRRNPWGRLAVERRRLAQAGEAPPLEASLAARWAWPEHDPLLSAPPDPGPGETDLRLAQGAPATSGAAAADTLALLSENRWGETALAGPEALIHLPSFLAARGVEDVDFVKIDTDGPDYGILTSLGEVATRSPAVGMGLEVNFHGAAAPHHHSFHNTDRFMRARGFDLFGLTVRSYASAALPSAFAERPTGKSQTGRPMQGDALYARDTGWKGAAEPWPALAPAKLVKLAAAFALFGLPDQAAEVLLRHRETLAPRLDIGEALDVLTAEAWPGAGLGHAELMARFDADDPLFHPPI